MKGQALEIFFPATDGICSYWSTRPTHKHGRLWSLFSYMSSVRTSVCTSVLPHLSKGRKTKQFDCGSGRVDHWWHLSCQLFFPTHGWEIIAKHTHFFFISAGSEELNDIDSLDGGLPSSAGQRSLVPDPSNHVGEHQHHPLGKVSPVGTQTEEEIANNNNNTHSHFGGVGSNPAAFTKGPGAKNKRHRKFNKESVRGTIKSVITMSWIEIDPFGR